MRRRFTFHLLLHILCFISLPSLLLVVSASEYDDEKDILLQFKGNISRDPYNSLLSWLPNNHPCLNYYGVYCNPIGHVDRLVLWNTSLAGPLPPVLSSLKHIRVISLYGNHFTGNIPPQYAQLTTLWKINVSSNSLFGPIPRFLGDLPNIRFLDLSYNGFSGEIPSVFFNNCAKAKFISLSHNNLSSPIPRSISNCPRILGFDFSYNHLTGDLPYQVCASSTLTYLSVRANVLSGEVTEQLSACKSLELLDLSSNKFTGLAPFSNLNMPNLTYFNISHNGFQGQVMDISECKQNLQVFDVSSNNIVGEIPSSITSCKGLKVLDVGFNRIDGSIPVEIGDLMKLLVIILAGNSIKGTIPIQIGNIQLLQVLDLHNLNLVGTIPDSISNCRFLLALDVSGNKLQGAIPDTLNNMTYLEILDLHQNRFNGSIPSSLGSLLGLQLLDLSQNSLSGSIPSSLQNLTMLSHFNVSSNNLSGAIPSSPNLQLFGSTAFVQNPGLCGPPLSNPCGATRRTKKLSVSSIIAIVAACLILTGVCITSIMNIRAQRKRRRKGNNNNQGAVIVESTPLGSSESNLIIGKLVLFSKSLPSKYEDWEAGTKALLDKDCLIGGGSIGTVYRANFEGGVSIAVKKIETLGRIRNQDEFEAEIGRLGSLQNPNLVSFQGYYWSSSMQLILSEFIPNGNLYDNLHKFEKPGTSSGGGSSSELFWSRRFKIALGSARALAYLHHDCRPQILHLNIKSRNILLDANYEAKVSDYGLAKLLPMLDNNGLTKYHNAVGYVAPELGQSLRVSEKCDIYSFGVVLLELVTGRKPVERIEGNVVVILCEHVRQVLERGDASDCFDTRLRGFVENELIQVMKLGLLCTSDTSSRRPSMAEVVQVLESIHSET